MKKTLVALAALASVSAFAQSSVTAYGVLDTAYYSGKAVAAAGQQTVYSGLTNGTLAGPRLGFKGTEDVGNGTKVNFVTEMSLNFIGDAWGVKTDGALNPAANKTTDGTVATPYNRQTWVGLSNDKAGEIRLGYQQTLQYDHNAPYSAGFEGAAGAREHLEVLNAAGLASNTGTQAASNYETNRAVGVTYFSPAYNGLKGAFQWGALKAEQTLGTVPATAATNAAGAHSSAQLTYDNGPLSTSYVTGRSKFATNATSGFLSAAPTVFTNSNSFGASYDLGVAKLFGYTGHRLTYADATYKDINVKVNRAGVQVPVGNFKLFATKGTVTGKQDDVVQSHRQTFQTGALYSLSKRTTLYTVYGRDKDDVALTGYTTTGAGIAAAAAPAQLSTFRVGINHAF